MMKIGLLIYRGVYCGFALLVLLNCLNGILEGEVGAAYEIILSWLFVGVLAFAIVAAFIFSRMAPLLMWVGILILCGFLAWYGWFGPDAPFVLHEIHTFDPAQAAIEIARFRVNAIVAYVIMVIWFLSLPIVRTLYRTRAVARP